MFAKTVTIDRTGRIALPKQVLETLGVRPEDEVIIEITGTEVLIKPKQTSTPITSRIAAMNLPVGDWEQMAKEIEEGRSN